MKLKHSVFAGFLALAAPFAAEATPLNGTSIDNLNVNGSLYNVTFEDGSYNSVFSSTPPVFLGDSIDAEAGLNAIIASPGFVPLTADFSDVIVPDFLDPSSGFNAWVGGGTIGLGQYFANPVTLDYSDSASGLNYTFAVFSAAGVPEPVTLSLFGAGLVGAAAMRRRKKA